MAGLPFRAWNGGVCQRPAQPLSIEAMSLFCPDAFISPLEIEAAITGALEEDLGRAGDITSLATVPEDALGRAVLNAREAGVVAGLPLAFAAFRRLAPDIEI